MGFLSFVKSVGRAVDPTYSKGTIGRVTAPVARPIVATAAVGLTGGAALIARPSLARPALQGYAAGAAIGTGVAAGGLLGGITASASRLAGMYAPAAFNPAGSVTNGQSATGDPATGAGMQPTSNRGTIFLIAILGLVGLIALIWRK